MNDKNRLWNCKNPYQTDALKVLCVCSAGLLRSPTLANYLHKKYGYNTRSCGVYDYALIPIDKVLITWADRIIVCSHDHEQIVFNFNKIDPTFTIPLVVNLGIPDDYSFMDPNLLFIFSLLDFESLLRIKDKNINDKL